MTLNSPPTCSLSPVIPNNARHLRLTAAAGTKLAVASSGIPQRTGVLALIAWWSLTVVYIPKDFILHAASLDQAFAHCQYSLLQPPVGVWAVSQSQCAGSTSQSRYPSKPW